MKDHMAPFHVTVATESGRVSYIAISTSSSQAAIDALDLFALPCAVTVVRA